MDYNNIEVIQLTKQLVEIESTNVGKFEKEIGDFVANWLETQTGLPVIKDEFEPGRFNVVCIVPGKIKDPAFVSIHHMDVVPAGEGWDTDPFKPVLIGDKMYGRGTVDMKAGLAAGMIVFRDIARLGKTPERDYVFIASADEEGNIMTGAMQALKSGYITKNSFVLDHEPTMGKIFPGHKGKTWFEITVNGQPAHGSTPWKGADAIVAMSEIVCNIRDHINSYPEDKVFGRSSVCFGTIKGGINTNVVAESCKVTLDMRLAPPLTSEDSIKLVENAVRVGCSKVPGTTGSIEIIAKRPYVLIDESSVLLNKLKETVKEVTGEIPDVEVFTGYTDSGVVSAETGNINCMSYGPKGGNYHQANEWVDCPSVLEVCEVARKIADKFLFEAL